MGRNCVRCMDNCRICENVTTCTKCFYPNTLIQGKCITLADGSSGALKNGSREVVRCPIGCLSCTIDNKNDILCSEAVEGYSILDGLISKCSINCLTCSPLNQYICTSCFLGFALVNGKCQKCTGSNALECL